MTRVVNVAVFNEDGTISMKPVDLTIEYMNEQKRNWNKHPEFGSYYPNLNTGKS